MSDKLLDPDLSENTQQRAGQVATNALEIRSLNFSYSEEGTLALEDINLSVRPGQAVLLCGASGCGKSSLLQCINGIIPEQIEGTFSGSIHMFGKDITAQPVREISKDMGSVFQNPKRQFFHLNTTDELFFAAANNLVPLDLMEQRLYKLAAEFKIEHLVNRHIFDLSGGEKQMIACASVALNKPRIYLLDEPSSNLDEESIARLTEILTLLKSQGATILIAEHRLYYALEFCDEVLYLSKGKIQQKFSKQEFQRIDQDTRKQMGLRSLTHHKLSEVEIPQVSQCKDEALEVENMLIKYRNGHCVHVEKALIPKHKIVAILGRNGAGKSSFVNAFCGIHKTKGAMLDKKPMKPKRQIRDCFMVMQDVDNQLYGESVLDELMCMTDDSDQELNRAKEVLERLNLLDFQECHPQALSGGQKQRLAIATALFLNKRYLIFDEPTSGLDYDNMIRVSEILQELKSSVHCVMVITHDSELVAHCCDYALRIEKNVSTNSSASAETNHAPIIQ